ncbi:195_t:CDS:2, partial [Ambispora leptoticha]
MGKKVLQEVKLKTNIEAAVDTERGCNHGAWAALKIAFLEPKDIPMVQVSFTRNASYEPHIRRGKSKIDRIDKSSTFDPTDEHLVPLHIMAGGWLARKIYQEMISGM